MVPASQVIGTYAGRYTGGLVAKNYGITLTRPSIPNSSSFLAAAPSMRPACAPRLNKWRNAIASEHYGDAHYSEMPVFSKFFSSRHK